MRQAFDGGEQTHHIRSRRTLPIAQTCGNSGIFAAERINVPQEEENRNSAWHGVQIAYLALSVITRTGGKISLPPHLNWPISSMAGSCWQAGKSWHGNEQLPPGCRRLPAAYDLLLLSDSGAPGAMLDDGNPGRYKSMMCLCVDGSGKGIRA